MNLTQFESCLAVDAVLCENQMQYVTGGIDEGAEPWWLTLLKNLGLNPSGEATIENRGVRDSISSTVKTPLFEITTTKVHVDTTSIVTIKLGT